MTVRKELEKAEEIWLNSLTKNTSALHVCMKYTPCSQFELVASGVCVCVTYMNFLIRFVNMIGLLSSPQHSILKSQTASFCVNVKTLNLTLKFNFDSNYNFHPCQRLYSFSLSLDFHKLPYHKLKIEGMKD